MDVQASEKEQVEALRKWWKENGSSVVTGVLLGLSVLLGTKAWQSYQERQALNASNIYAQLLVFSGADSVDEKTAGQVQALANQLIADHSGSVYASLAALVLARQAVEEGEPDAARAQLQWALEHADSAEIVHTARTRLIRLLLDQAMYDEAASRLDAVTEPGAYAHRYSELRGDLEAARGEPAAAAQAYRQALDQLPAGAANLAVLTAKYESVGGGETP